MCAGNPGLDTTLQEMADQDSKAYANQYESTKHPGGFAEHTAGTAPDVKADGGNHESHATNKQAGHKQAGLGKCEAKSNSHGVDAGGDGQGQQQPTARGIATVLPLLVVEGLPDHLAADEGKQGEGDIFLASPAT